MEYHDHEQLTPEEVLAEVASILARGYMRHVKTRSQGLDGNERSGDVGDGENTAALTENRLDCPRNRSNHSEPCYGLETLRGGLE